MNVFFPLKVQKFVTIDNMGALHAILSLSALVPEKLNQNLLRNDFITELHYLLLRQANPGELDVASLASPLQSGLNVIKLGYFCLPSEGQMTCDQ